MSTEAELTALKVPELKVIRARYSIRLHFAR